MLFKNTQSWLLVFLFFFLFFLFVFIIFCLFYLLLYKRRVQKKASIPAASPRVFLFLFFYPGLALMSMSTTGIRTGEKVGDGGGGGGVYVYRISKDTSKLFKNPN